MPPPSLPSVGTTVFNAQSKAIREIIGAGAYVHLTKRLPFFRDIVESNIEVVGANGRIGRDQRWKKFYYEGRAGVIRGGQVTAYHKMFGENAPAVGTKLHLNTFSQTVPNPEYGAQPKPFELVGSLFSFEANLALPESFLTLEAMEANLKQHVMPVVKGHAALYGDFVVHCFLGRRKDHFRLCTVKAASVVHVDDGSGSAGGGTVTFETTEKVAARLHVGTPVDLWDGGLGTPANNARINTKSGVRIPCFVETVNRWTNKVTVRAHTHDESGNAITFSSDIKAKFGNGVGTDDGQGTEFLTFMNQASAITSATSDKFDHFYGLFDWLKFPGGSTADELYILGDAASSVATERIDVNEYPMFSSGLHKINGVLTERALFNLLMEDMDILAEHEQSLDTMLFCRGVTAQLFGQQLGRETLERANRAGSIVMGVNKMPTVTLPNGKTFEFMETGYMNDGVGVIFQARDNWEFVAPSQGQYAQKMGSEGESLLSKLPFYLTMPRLTEGKMATWPIQKTSGASVLPSTGFMMPSYGVGQFMPKKQIPGVVLSGITTVRTFSDTGTF